MPEEPKILDPIEHLVEKLEAWLPHDDDGVSLKLLREIQRAVALERKTAKREYQTVRALHKRNDELVRAVVDSCESNEQLVKLAIDAEQKLLELDDGRTTRSRSYWWRRLHVYQTHASFVYRQVSKVRDDLVASKRDNIALTSEVNGLKERLDIEKALTARLSEQLKLSRRLVRRYKKIEVSS